MRDRLADAVLASLIGCLVWLALQRQAQAPLPPLPVPVPVVPVTPRPQPEPRPRPRKPQQHLLTGEAKVGGLVSPDGKEEIQIFLPDELQVKNVGGSDGAGLCTFTSVQFDARVQNIYQLAEFQKFMKAHPGGGYPSKMDHMIELLCKEKGYPLPDYLQVEGNDLEILRAALASGRPCGVTYSFSPSGRYGGSRIAHMTTLGHLTQNWAAIYDNNFIGEKNVEWMTPQEFLKTYTGGSKGWAVILLGPGSAPAPHNH